MFKGKDKYIHGAGPPRRSHSSPVPPHTHTESPSSPRHHFSVLIVTSLKMNRRENEKWEV